MLPLFALLSGCDPLAERGFVVTLTFPDDGARAAPTTPVRVGFSQAPDVAACEQGVALVALGEDDRAAWEVPFSLVEDEGADKPHTWLLEHDELLVVDLEYAIVVSNGEAGCVSERGDDVVPHVSRFTVIERQAE